MVKSTSRCLERNKGGKSFLLFMKRSLQACLVLLLHLLSLPITINSSFSFFGLAYITKIINKTLFEDWAGQDLLVLSGSWLLMFCDYNSVMKWFQFDNPAFKVKVLDYTYTSEPSINTALPVQTSKIKTILFIFGVILTFGFLWLLSKWSARKKALFLTTISSLPTATHFLIQDEDSQGEMTLVQRQDKYEIRLKRTCPSFIYRDRNYIYVQEKEVFVPIRYEQLGHHLDKLKRDKFRPLSEQRRKQLLGYYGENVMKLQIQSRLQIFIQQMLTPYQVFQTYGIILWIYQEYYVFSFILMAYSLYTYWMSSSEIRSNQQKLAYESYFDVQTKVLVDDGSSTEEDQEEVQLCTNGLKIDEHRSQIMKEDFNGVDNEDVEMTVVKRRSKEVKNQENNLINNRNVRFQTISSHHLVPGDIIILNELDIVPCDCILLRGQALANEKYSTGQNYLIRKEEIQNFTYLKENQKSFVLYLGSQIVKTKNIEYKSKRTGDNQLECIENSMREDRIDSASQIVCLVTHTNFSTLRGKYLRAIRYQSKNKQQFFRETIYFIYIIIFIASIVYFAYLAVLGPYTREIDMFRMYMDLLITAIPPTLPTILNVGIEFVTRRLKAQGINSVMAKSILTGGKIDTIILKGDQVFGKEYEIHSAAIGTKGQRGFGLTFASVNEFEAYHDSQAFSGIEELQRRQQEKSEFYRVGSFFINALACCHTLEFFNRETHGSVFQKKIFEFSQSRNIKEDQFQTLNHSLQVKKIIRFKAKVAKLAVLVVVKDKREVLERSEEQERAQQSLEIDENEVTIKHNRRRSIEQQQGSRQYIFLKGAAQKVLHNCAPHSYPQNAFEYIVDMAQKGFILHAYAMRPFTVQTHDQFDFPEYVSHCEFTFLGFVVLQQAKSQQNMQAIRQLNAAAVKIIFVSEQRELDAASKAMFNGICSKNELLLCGLAKNREKVVCKGHIQWQSSSGEMFSEFVTEFQEFGRGSKVSLSAELFEELFMKREMAAARQLFEKAIIFNKMEIKHQKNLFNQLERDGKICCAVGRSGSLYESANLTLELQREHGALLSSFYTSSTSLKSIVNCLRICRAGLSTNLHGFGMMILFSLIQLTTTVILNMNYESLTTDQSLYEDLFITFPIFVTINLTQPATLLSKELPPNSFFSLRNVLSMVGQLLIQFLAQFGFILYVLSLQFFKQERSESHDYYIENGNFRSGSALTLALFVLSNNLYLGIVLSTSVSKPFRKPFYTNPFYTLNLILIWCYNTFLVIFPSLSPTEMRSKTLNQQSEFVLIVALLVGNLVMVVMYMYENLLVFLWGKENPCLKRKQGEEYQLEQGIK